MSIKAPQFLSTSGKRRFQTLAKQIKKPTETQVQLLGLLAQSWENYLAAQTDINTNGFHLESGKVKKKNPAVDLMHKERQAILDISETLGLIPQDKQEVKREQPRSPLEALMRGKSLVVDEGE